MTSHTPPRLATWLLKHLLHGRHKESLVGDLIQLHHEGRSNIWYWRQVLASIRAEYVTASRARALAVGLAVAWGAIFIWAELNAAFISNSGKVYWFLRDVMRSSETALDARNYVFVLVWGIGAILRIVCFAASGWIVARFNSSQQRISIALLAVSSLIWSIPWEQLRVIEADVLWLIHYGSGLLGILIGGSLAITQGAERKRAGTTARD